MSSEDTDIDLSLAATVCMHVANDRHPILLAEKGKPIAPEDSGWQFMCNSGVEEDDDESQVWAIGEVLEFEPSLLGKLDSPSGARLVRSKPGEPWELQPPLT